MIVVSDTSPLSYLLLIECADVPPSLFGDLHIPGAVGEELKSPTAPARVRAWIAEPPAWLRIHDAPAAESPPLSQLHAGEREAIALAEAMGADMIFIDEKAARRIAIERGLRVTGLLGLLVEASERGLLDLPLAVEKLRRTNFRASPRLLKAVLERRK